MSEIIDITPTARLVIEQDYDAENPREAWDHITGFVGIPNRGDSRRGDVPPVHEPPLPVHDAYYRFFGSPSRYTDIMWRQHDEAQQLVVRWARAFYGLHLEYDHEHGGFWFVDPKQFVANFPEGTSPGLVKRFRQKEGAPINTYENYEQDALECQAQVIENERETYEKWADGEVYGVVLERTATWVKLGEHGEATEEMRDDWEHVDSLWGCYLDDEYTAQAVALENFPLTTTEQAALR